MLRKRDNRGFSLIELMIVVAIIGILVAVALPQFKSMTDDAKIAKMKEDMRVLLDAIIRYNSKERLPLESLDNLLGKYMGTVPTDPWGNRYKIAPHLGILYSFGPDGKEGTFDDYKVVYDTNKLKQAKSEYQEALKGSEKGEVFTHIEDGIDYLAEHSDGLLLLAFVYSEDGGASLSFIQFLKESGASKLQTEFQIKVTLVDFYRDRFIFAKYGITSTPTFILLNSSQQPLGKFSGFSDEEDFLWKLEDILKKVEGGNNG